MCGIAGIAWTDSQRETPTGQIERMTRRLTHRGPDGEGYLALPGVSFGHRRLSIIDLEGGAQPITNEDETIWLTFNGEIYNFQELRRDLIARGHRFKTSGDSETLVHLYEDHGPQMLEKLRGMFAIAIWDVRRKELFLARDRLGKKPLVYWMDSEAIRFSSELKSLIADNNFPRNVDEAALDDYLTYQYVPHPRTIFRSAHKLPPAHYAIFHAGKLDIHRYWHPPFETEVKLSEAEYIENLRELLTESTRLRMIADVPVGAFLSGGVDSTIITGLMRKVSNSTVRTFSIGFPIAEYDETSYARQAAKHLHTEHEEFLVEPEAVSVASQLAWFFDEPFADSSAIPTYYVSKLTRQHVKVALTGDAGDELFAGYPRYQAVRIGEHFDRMPQWLRTLATARLWQALPASPRQKSTVRRAKKLLKMLARNPEDRYRQFVTIFDDVIRNDLYSHGFRRALGEHKSCEWIDNLYRRFPQRDFLTRTTAVDIDSYLPCDLLTKVDISSMANSLECRAPLLDHKVVELAAQMPVELKLKGRTTKYIFKKAFAEYLPGKLGTRAKMGFGVPLDHWLRTDLSVMMKDLLGSHRFRDRGWFDGDVVERLMNEHLQRKWDHSARLWALIMLEQWARNYLDQP